MKALVTGGEGQLARALAHTAPAGWSVDLRGRTDLDIVDQGAVSAALVQVQPDLLINCAAYTAVDQAESAQEEAMRINGLAVAELASAVAQAGCRLVQISTDFVFDGAAGRPYRPDDAPRPINAYGRSKLAGERAALSYAGSLVIRTAWLYSAFGHNFALTVLRRIQEGKSLRVVDDQLGTPSHCLSLAATVWGLADLGVTGIWHATDAGVASRYDFAVAIQEEALAAGLLEAPVAITPVTSAAYPSAAARPPNSVLDKSATWEALAAPARHWRDELREMLTELRNG